ncbi:branched-chain amino acid ABC transporter substrate-binding protein [Streptomyces sp. MUM 136J]|uniref:branched-chain amino acid ABC transporter substrate-binding protein n=1 Tax=Streptomyces sp. MUM 136J TaxID=2791992 RepID=UPI001F04BD7A|nr:branched-chain amino acid ABC transporter substrate-binding protein [Streptomyces sp. MUM 136J]MCH0569139.1 branched-chain amino acid ABC transporter substrate-binding protein [Streptomyces sp. MUM 136J]
MENLTRRLGAGIALTGVALLSACGGNGSSGGDDGSGPIRIGVSAPLSGDSAAAGTDIVNAAKLAVKKINKEGLLGGRKVEIVQVDDACDAQTGTAAMRRLLTQKVVAVAGGYCSGAVIPETMITDRAGIPFIADASTNVEITERGLKHVFRTIGRDDKQSEFAARYMVEYLKADNVAVIHDNTAYSKGLAEATKDTVRKLGAKTVFYDAITPGAKDFTSFLTKAKSTRPQAIYFTGYYADAGLLLKQADELGIDVPIIGGDANQDPTVIRTAGRAAEGFTTTTAPLPDFIKSTADFVSAYKSEYGTEPGPYAPYEYDAVNVLADAIARAGSADSEKVTEALHATKDYAGVTGPINFDEKGDRVHPVYVTAVVEGGVFVPGKKLDESGNWVDAKG